MDNTKILLEVKNLQMHFPVEKGFFSKNIKYVKAVDDVSFSVINGKTFGLVGETGCGKSTVGKCVLRVFRPTSGSICYNNQEIATASDRELQPIRREIQLIFQDPYGSLDPRQSVFSILKEAFVSDRKQHSREEVNRRVRELLSLVELSDELRNRYPHEMSGGQRQRVAIARAIACDPKLIVCDEPVSALDVSIQAQIINLFKRLQKQLGLTFLFIAHDLAVVKHIADEVAVMYLGNLVEIMDAEELYTHPLHPYSKALLSAVPITDYYVEQKRDRIILQGEVPSPIDSPSGCPFHPRCPFVKEICIIQKPSLKEYRPNHLVACHRVGEIN